MAKFPSPQNHPISPGLLQGWSIIYDRKNFYNIEATKIWGHLPMRPNLYLGWYAENLDTMEPSGI